MRFQRLLALSCLSVSLLLGGWRISDAAVTALEVEHYRLVQVNGRPLPFLLYAVEDDCEVDVVAGILEVDPSRRRYVLLERVREDCAWSGPDEVETRDSGRYQVDARELRFRSDRETTPTWTGAAKGNTLELVRGGRAYAYRR